MVSKSGPNTFIPMGARIPVCNITSLVCIGCNFGADVNPGMIGLFNNFLPDIIRRMYIVAPLAEIFPVFIFN